MKNIFKKVGIVALVLGISTIAYAKVMDGNLDILGTLIVRGLTSIYSGGDLNMYSDTGSTLKFKVDGATGNFGIPADSAFYLGSTALSGNLSIKNNSATSSIDLSAGPGLDVYRFNSTELGLDTDLDIATYSSGFATQSARLDGATGIMHSRPTQYGQIIGCTLTDNGTSTLSFESYNGGSISTSNPCLIGSSQGTTSDVRGLSMTAGNSSTFGAASDTDGNTFGLTDAVDQAVLPMFVGITTKNGTTAVPFLSRHPLKRMPSTSAEMCQEGDTDCDGEGDAFLMVSGDTVASYVNASAIIIGWVRATFTGATSSWDFDTGNFYGGGLNDRYEDQVFTVSPGQFGNDSGSCFDTTGGDTAPAFTNCVVKYKIDKYGTVWVSVLMNADAGTDGSGSNPMTIILPYTMTSATTTASYGSFQVTDPTGTYIGTGRVPASSNVLTIQVPTVSGTALQNSITGLTPGRFTNGSRLVQGSIIYSIFDNIQ